MASFFSLKSISGTLLFIAIVELVSAHATGLQSVPSPVSLSALPPNIRMLVTGLAREADALALAGNNYAVGQVAWTTNATGELRIVVGLSGGPSQSVLNSLQSRFPGVLFGSVDPRYTLGMNTGGVNGHLACAEHAVEQAVRGGALSPSYNTFTFSYGPNAPNPATATYTMGGTINLSGRPPMVTSLLQNPTFSRNLTIQEIGPCASCQRNIPYTDAALRRGLGLGGRFPLPVITSSPSAHDAGAIFKKATAEAVSLKKNLPVSIFKQNLDTPKAIPKKVAPSTGSVRVSLPSLSAVMKGIAKAAVAVQILDGVLGSGVGTASAAEVERPGERCKSSENYWTSFISNVARLEFELARISCAIQHLAPDADKGHVDQKIRDLSEGAVNLFDTKMSYLRSVSGFDEDQKKDETIGETYLRYLWPGVSSTITGLVKEKIGALNEKRRLEAFAVGINRKIRASETYCRESENAEANEHAREINRMGRLARFLFESDPFAHLQITCDESTGRLSRELEEYTDPEGYAESVTQSMVQLGLPSPRRRHHSSITSDTGSLRKQ